MSIEEVRYSVTILYYQKTGNEFANHLKDGLEDVGVRTFLDTRDIPKTVESGGDKWRSYVNKAIIESNKVILIMTFGFNTRNEVIRELEFTWNNKKDILLCKDVNLPKEHMIIRMKDKEIDLSELEYILFTDKEDLLRKIGGLLFDAKSTQNYDYVNRINKIIATNGIGLKSNDYPIMEIVMVPKYSREDLLEANEDNRMLVSIAPWFSHSVSLTRKYYFGETLDNEDFLVYSTGETYFIHIFIIEPYDHYIDNLMSDTINNVLFINRIMKKKNIEKEYIIYTKLSQMNGYSFFFTGRGVSRNGYYFPAKEQIEYDYKFNTKDEWVEYKMLFYKIFKDICLDLGISKIQDRTIHKRIYDILRNSPFPNTHFTTQNVKRIDIEAFNYAEDEKKWR